MRIPYLLLCTLLGLVLGWLPWFIHGPISYKLDAVRMNGAIAVWGFYSARMLIGLMVGATHWPPRWYLRGPLCGFIMMLPLGLISLATPGCAWP